MSENNLTSAAKAKIEREKFQVDQPTAETTMDVNAYLNERVFFQAIKDNERYKDDISVTINGKAYLIQRGKPVMIPRFVYEALMDAEQQKGYASIVSQGFEDDYSKHTRNNIF